MPVHCVLVGDVGLKAVNRRSKSAHEAVVLITAERSVVLRRRGAPSYGDPVLLEFVGRRVRAEGTLSAGQLICDVIEPQDTD